MTQVRAVCFTVERFVTVFVPSLLGGMQTSERMAPRQWQTPLLTASAAATAIAGSARVFAPRARRVRIPVALPLSFRALILVCGPCAADPSRAHDVALPPCCEDSVSSVKFAPNRWCCLRRRTRAGRAMRLRAQPRASRHSASGARADRQAVILASSRSLPSLSPPLRSRARGTANSLPSPRGITPVASTTTRFAIHR